MQRQPRSSFSRLTSTSTYSSSVGCQHQPVSAVCTVQPPVDFHSTVNVVSSTPSSATVTVDYAATAFPSTNTTVKHPDHKGPVLKRIPKAARPVAANLMQKLIRGVLLHLSSNSSWCYAAWLSFSLFSETKPWWHIT